jgi:hypothetical protein
MCHHWRHITKILDKHTCTIIYIFCLKLTSHCIPHLGLHLPSHISGFTFHLTSQASPSISHLRLYLPSHISGFTFHLTSQASPSISHLGLHLPSHISGLTFHLASQASPSISHLRLHFPSHISGFTFKVIFLWEIYSRKTYQQLIVYISRCIWNQA